MAWRRRGAWQTACWRSCSERAFAVAGGGHPIALARARRMMLCSSGAGRQHVYSVRGRGLAEPPSVLQSPASGEMDERFKSHAWKACIG